jgi:hypothetical protein
MLAFFTPRFKQSKIVSAINPKNLLMTFLHYYFTITFITRCLIVNITSATKRLATDS